MHLQLFEFAKAHKGTYDGECPFYCSFSGYNVIFLHPSSSVKIPEAYLVSQNVYDKMLR